MPLNKNQRGAAAMPDANRPPDPAEQHGHGDENERGAEMDAHGEDATLTLCCVPTGCDSLNQEPINTSDPGDAVRVYCNNEQCEEGQWMHKDCFEHWEFHVLSFLKTCGRARSWSEKQRLQNLWTKKGYDLAYKACNCKCGRGHLRKDLNYHPQTKAEERKPKKSKKKTEKLTMPPAAKSAAAVVSSPVQSPIVGAVFKQKQPLRVRTGSIGSTGSASPPSSASVSGSPPVMMERRNSRGTPQGRNGCRFDFFTDNIQAAAGNIFKRRTNFSVFNTLPKHQQNPYHIKMEDEGPHGNDEIRCFILTNLSTHQVTKMNCVICNDALNVYDRYPLIDGTFFLSPLRYNNNIQVLLDGRMQYLNAVCLRCLSSNLLCVSCKQPWNDYGSTLIIGTMYSYDIFAAVPCCGHRLTCKHCTRLIMDPGACAFQFFSDYSRAIQCPHCHIQDFHFVKGLQQSFTKQLTC